MTKQWAITLIGAAHGSQGNFQRAGWGACRLGVKASGQLQMLPAPPVIPSIVVEQLLPGLWFCNECDAAARRRENEVGKKKEEEKSKSWPCVRGKGRLA